MNRPAAQIHIALMLAASVVLLFALLVYVVYAHNLITFPFDYDQGEGFELVDTVMFSQLRWPYQNTEVYPFYSSNYPPLFHVIAAPFVWFFGAEYWYGRLLGFLGTLVTAGAVSYAVFREGGRRWIALLAGLAFLSSNTVYHIGPLFRQHMTMVLFETLAVVLLAYAFPQQKTRRIALGLLLIIAAGYTKQLAAITALSVIGWMMLRNPRRGVLWGAGFALTGAAIFMWMTWATGGEWWRQAILANANPVNPIQVFNLSLLWFQLHGFLLVPALLYALYELYFERLSLYSVWFIGTAVLGAAGSGAWGAGDSYFATSIAAACILSGILFSRVLNGEKWRSVALLIVPLCYLGYGIATVKMPTEGAFFGTLSDVLRIEPNVRGRFYDSASYNIPGYANIGYLTTEEDIAAGYYIVDLIRATDKPVLSEEAGFSFEAGRDVISNPTQLLNLWNAGQFEGTEIIRMIEAQEFGLIILRAQFYPIPILEAIGQYYERSETVEMNGFNYLILRPAS